MAGWFLSAGTQLVVWVVLAICGCSGPSRTVTMEQIERLRSMEDLLPLPADSVVSRYRRYAPDVFYGRYSALIEGVTRRMDTLNVPLPAELRIDTLAIDHSFEGFGEAARRGKTLYVSSSYFYMYESEPVLRSVVTHEFGHRYYYRLSAAQRDEVRDIWVHLRYTSLLPLVKDGEYPDNARFGGHPEDSPEELFASAFNLLLNRRGEVYAKLQQVPAGRQTYVELLDSLVRGAAKGLP